MAPRVAFGRWVYGWILRQIRGGARRQHCFAGNRQFFASKEWRMLADYRKAWIFPPRRQTTPTFIFKPCCIEYVMR
jgi:hypothetical protein